jgi:monoamine oxidase
MRNVVVIGAGLAGLAAARRLVPRAPVGRLHWADVECAPRWNGYMEGAVRSREAPANAAAAL